MGSWFCCEWPIVAGRIGITEVFDEDTGTYVDVGATDLIFCCVEVMPMGWSWAMHFAQEAMCIPARAACPGGQGIGGMLEEALPVPLLGPSRPLVGIYVDNATIVGWSAKDTHEALTRFMSLCTASGWVVGEKEETTTQATSVGVSSTRPRPSWHASPRGPGWCIEHCGSSSFCEECRARDGGHHRQPHALFHAQARGARRDQPLVFLCEVASRGSRASFFAGPSRC